VTVTITRGADTITITAVPGETTYGSRADGGPRLEIATRIYLVDVAKYVFDGQTTTPAIGDRFSETINGAELVTECQTPENGEKEWRYSSRWRSRYRIHCKKVNT
jgi:hypothetical protein